jgi:hypothetical protein
MRHPYETKNKPAGNYLPAGSFYSNLKQQLTKSNSVVFANYGAITAGLACVPVFRRLDFFEPVELANVF